VLGTAALDEFVKAVCTAGDPVKAFEKMVGQPIAEFEREFIEWLGLLQPNGTVRKVGRK